MSGLRYTEEFKREAVAQITDRGHSVKSVAEGLGVCTKSIYDWVKRYGSQEPERRTVDAGRAENRRLKAELARVTEERDILNNGETDQEMIRGIIFPTNAYFASECR